MDLKGEDVISYWRSRIFRKILRSIIVVGFLAYVPSVIAAVLFQGWIVAVMDTLIIGAVIFLYYADKLPFKVQVVSLNIILYALGVGLIVFLGPLGAGWIWLFAFPVLSTILSGFRMFVISMALIVVTLLTLGIFLWLGLLDQLLISRYSIESWVIISINFLSINVLFCYPIGILVREMKKAIDKETEAQRLLLLERENLARNNSDLQRTNNDLDNFIYTASHDLKAPISNIEGLIDQLNRVMPQQEKEVGFIVELIRKSSSRLNKTIKDLTDISKIHHNLEGESKDLINLEEMISDILNDIAMKPSIHLQLEASEITFSAKNLRSILYNLISNAIKYGSPQHELSIDIRTRFENEFFILEVQDNGLGMADGYKEKIFKMFKRMHDHVEGSGLGLYILNRIVENNGGKIEVESQLGQGSLFRIYLKHLL